MGPEPHHSLRRPAWAALRAMAAGHHGVLTTNDWRDAGLHHSALSRAIARGDLVRLAPRVVLVPELLDDWSHLAAARRSTPGAVASHRSAALLLGLDGVEQDVVEVTVARKGAPRRPNVHRSEDLLGSEVTTVQGIPTTAGVGTPPAAHHRPTA